MKSAVYLLSATRESGGFTIWTVSGFTKANESNINNFAIKDFSKFSYNAYLVQS